MLSLFIVLGRSGGMRYFPLAEHDVEGLLRMVKGSDPRFLLAVVAVVEK